MKTTWNRIDVSLAQKGAIKNLTKVLSDRPPQLHRFKHIRLPNGTYIMQPINDHLTTTPAPTQPTVPPPSAGPPGGMSYERGISQAFPSQKVQVTH